MLNLDTGVRVSRAPSFDASQWLADFTALGGMYALGADRRLALVAYGPCAPDLAAMVAQIAGEPHKSEALRQAIEQRQCAEVE